MWYLGINSQLALSLCEIIFICDIFANGSISSSKIVNNSHSFNNLQIVFLLARSASDISLSSPSKIKNSLKCKT